MGAILEYEELEAKDKTELKAKFKHLQDDLCYMYGHDTYAGHLGIKDGLVINELLVAPEKAEQMIEDNEKWGPAQAIRIGKTRWLVGGWCAS